MPVSGIDGLASGIATGELIDATLEIERGSARVLEAKVEIADAKKEALRNLNVNLLSAQLDLSALRRAASTGGLSATSSSSSVLTANAGGRAEVGSHRLEVTALAAANDLLTGRFDSASSSVGAGTVTFRVGDGPVTSVTLDANNNTLEGLAKAINDAEGSQVSAAIINDGEGYRLRLTGSETGEGRQIDFDASGLGEDALKMAVAASGNTGSGDIFDVRFHGDGEAPEIGLRFVDDGGDTKFQYSLDGVWSTDLYEASSGGVFALDALNQDGSSAGSASGVSLTFGADVGFAVNDEFSLQSFKELSASSDAEVRMGASGSALVVKSATNTFEDLIPSVSFTAEEIGTTTLTVSEDTQGVKSALQSFLESFNEAFEYLQTNSSFNDETNEAGILQSENGILRDARSVLRTFLDAVPGLERGQNIAASFGLGLNEDGGISFSESAFDRAASTNASSVLALFRNSGSSDSTGVRFLTLGSATDMSANHDVDITQAATRAGMTGDLLGSDPITIDATNDTISFLLNGKQFDLTLAHATYDPNTTEGREALRSHMQSLLDASEATKTNAITVGMEAAGALSFTVERYGSQHSLNVAGGTARSVLGLDAVGFQIGKDVKGTIGGIEAQGVGQLLRGSKGSPSEGLALEISLTKDQVSAGGGSSSLTLIEGLAQRTERAMLELTDVTGGSIPNREDSLSLEVTDLTERIEDIDERLAVKRTRLERQFVAMERIMGLNQNQGDWLASQIQGFENFAAARSR